MNCYFGKLILQAKFSAVEYTVENTEDKIAMYFINIFPSIKKANLVTSTMHCISIKNKNTALSYKNNPKNSSLFPHFYLLCLAKYQPGHEKLSLGSINP